MKRRTNRRKHLMRGRTPLTTPCMPEMCGTCPFRQGSPYAELAPAIAASALTEASRICHSTGSSNLIHPEGTGKPERLCRGARNVQIEVMHAMGVIEAKTDEAWDKARAEYGC